jgi:cystathionine beta-lyase
MAKTPKRPLSGSTGAIRAGSASARDLVHTVGPPIERASTVLVDKAADLYAPGVVTYGRPNALVTHRVLAEAISEMEGGVGTELYPSGLSAITGPMLALLQAGDEVLVVDCAYAPVRRFCDGFLKRYGVATRYVGARATVDEIMAAATPATRMIVLEAPGSLTFELQDVPAIAAAARARGILTLIDNTYGAGFLFKPLQHGVDVSCQALTKYVGGHSDVLMGSAAVADKALYDKLRAGSRDLGSTVSPDDAYWMLRGLRTLPTRLAQHGASGLKVADWLAVQPEVARVIHPGRPDHPDHDLFQRDFSGPNGLFSLVLNPASGPQVLAFLDALELFGLGFSWGGFESLAIHCDPQLKRTAEPWKAEGPLIRLHIGLEDPDDLIADLRRGLDALGSGAA